MFGCPFRAHCFWGRFSHGVAMGWKRSAPYGASDSAKIRAVLLDKADRMIGGGQIANHTENSNKWYKFCRWACVANMPSEEKTVLVQSLFAQNMMAVRGFVITLMPDFSRVDDVMQETFLTVTAKAEAFVEGSNFRSWACSIARFKVLEALRRPGNGEVALDADVIEALCATEMEEWQPEEELRLLSQCTAELAPQARRVIELRYEQAHRPQLAPCPSTSSAEASAGWIPAMRSASRFFKSMWTTSKGTFTSSRMIPASQRNSATA